MGEGDCRDRLIDAALRLGVRGRHQAATIDDIAAAAEATAGDFTRYFSSKDEAVMSVNADLLQAIAAAVLRVDAAVGPERALLVATTEVLTAIIDGRGVMPLDRLLAMGHIVRWTPALKAKASVARKQVLSRALADRMGLDPDNRRVNLATTVWSAVASATYHASWSVGAADDPRRDHQVVERMTAELATSFGEVTGKDSGDTSDC